MQIFKFKNTFQLIALPTVLASSAILSGCGVFFGEDGIFRDSSNDYLKAESIPPIELAGNTNTEVFGELYVIPKQDKANYEYPDEFEVPRPDALSTSAFTEKVKIQRLGENRWIAINTSPAEVWPRVRRFLNSNGLSVDRTNPQEGIIETAWLQFKDDPDNRDKYRFSIEQGVQPDSAEIHVTHLSLSRDVEVPAAVDWSDKSTNAERESWMVDELAASLANDTGSGSASLLAQTIGGEDKIALVAKNQEPVLRMNLDQVRAWATLSYSLEQEGFRLIDENEDFRIFYVDYENPDESEGFFSGWFSDDEKTYPALDAVISQLNLQDTAENRKLFPAAAFASAQKRSDAAGYLVLVTPEAEGLEVSIRDASGQRLEPRQARELLTTIRRNLI